MITSYRTVVLCKIRSRYGGFEYVNGHDLFHRDKKQLPLYTKDGMKYSLMDECPGGFVTIHRDNVESVMNRSCKVLFGKHLREVMLRGVDGQESIEQINPGVSFILGANNSIMDSMMEYYLLEERFGFNKLLKPSDLNPALHKRIYVFALPMWWDNPYIDLIAHRILQVENFAFIDYERHLERMEEAAIKQAYDDTYQWEI